jgi:hypothetical protein
MSAVDQSETTVGGGLSWKTKSPWRITCVTHQGLQLHEPDADEPHPRLRPVFLVGRHNVQPEAGCRRRRLVQSYRPRKRATFA